MTTDTPESTGLLKEAEILWTELQENKLGGFSGINRPFWIVNTFKQLIEKERPLAEARGSASRDAEIKALREENHYFRTEYQDEAGIQQLRELLRFAQDDIAAAEARGAARERERILALLREHKPSLVAQIIEAGSHYSGMVFRSRAVIDALAAYITEHPAEPPADVVQGDGWQPIETAPKDGTIVDLWCEYRDGGSRRTGCRWHTGDERWIDDRYMPFLVPVTHWRLPPPPPADSEKGEGRE